MHEFTCRGSIQRVTSVTRRERARDTGVIELNELKQLVYLGAVKNSAIAEHLHYYRYNPSITLCGKKRNIETDTYTWKNTKKNV